jgi:hypothetical protein
LLHTINHFDMPDIHLYYLISSGLLFGSCMLSGLELLSIRGAFLNFVYPTTAVADKSRPWTWLNLAQVLLALGALVSLLNAAPIVYLAFLLPLTGVNLYIYTIRKVGKDGADQMRILGLVYNSLCLVTFSPHAETIVLCFLGAQVIIGYATSAIVKLSSPHWRKGLVLAEIMGTYSYGVVRFSAFLKKHEFIQKMCTYGAIASMLSVPIAFFHPDIIYVVIALGIMLFFHFQTALLMGLNDFLFTFPLAYPGVILLHNLVFGQ